MLAKFPYRLPKLFYDNFKTCLSRQPYRTNLPALQFSPNDLTGSRLNGGHLGSIEYKYPVHGHNFHSFATVNYQLPRGETLFHLPLTSILEIFKDFFACKFVLAAIQQQSEIFKDFFACKFVLAAIQQQSENIQRLFRLQICLSRKSSTTRKYSKTFPPAKLS